jgi:hypothetical protein
MATMDEAHPPSRAAADERAGLLQFALELARVAEAEILPRFRRVLLQPEAGRFRVTEADREAERAMRAAIQQRFPEHAVLGEELGASGAPDAQRRWVLDPVDATGWFTLGLPTAPCARICPSQKSDEAGRIPTRRALGKTVASSRPWPPGGQASERSA